MGGQGSLMHVGSEGWPAANILVPDTTAHLQWSSGVYASMGHGCFGKPLRTWGNLDEWDVLSIITSLGIKPHSNHNMTAEFRSVGGRTLWLSFPRVQAAEPAGASVPFLCCFWHGAPGPSPACTPSAYNPQPLPVTPTSYIHPHTQL
ncbi:hypothetical protein DPX16_11289 [Anabarilius grahami]|uniref:Uncharacterized protein n=1 Tax=Anabarilius grahami TaxID=495550 RepID=A0A3N0XJ93_ANAGA|nr:hypothetical protein DPX16_11289 [Anabarilius grahami]